MNIAIASGKGGTGKTTFAVSLASFLSREKTVALLDGDVEAPNSNLFLKVPVAECEQVSVPVPAVIDDRCTGCGACEDFCEFSAIVVIKGKPLVLPEMCHSCGGCLVVCPEKALHEVPRPIGVIETGERDNILYAGGVLNIGEPMAPPLIKELKKYHYIPDIRILDCPPGTSCPVIEAARGCDYLLLVTESSPFGLNDLKLAVGMARELSLPFGVALNRADDSFRGVEEFCSAENIPLVARIPFDLEVAGTYSRGEMPFILKKYPDQLESIMKDINLRNRRSLHL
ncbi:MAG TPA: ATP-binding protein [Spirochaetota bacterium]|nr:ATP-binding protein [Spirochaetota bacterium]HPR48309.1 ATP-binding protein [Spirochaetota bacterium]